MRVTRLNQGSLTIEHEGETFKLLGELGTTSFIAWKSSIERVACGSALSEEEKSHVMQIILECWREECGISFVNDNWDEIGWVKGAKPQALRRRGRFSLWRRRNGPREHGDASERQG